MGLRRIVLVVVKGPDVGRSIVLPAGHCVMVGRSPSLGAATGMLTQHSLARLDDEDEATVARHLTTRAPTKGGRAILGSFDRDPDVTLNDDAVSARHAMVFCDEAGASLVDMASTNGTFLNGARVAEGELTVGDLVRIGETRLAVHA